MNIIISRHIKQLSKQLKKKKNCYDNNYKTLKWHIRIIMIHDNNNITLCILYYYKGILYDFCNVVRL